MTEEEAKIAVFDRAIKTAEKQVGSAESETRQYLSEFFDKPSDQTRLRVVRMLKVVQRFNSELFAAQAEKNRYERGHRK